MRNTFVMFFSEATFKLEFFCISKIRIGFYLLLFYLLISCSDKDLGFKNQMNSVMELVKTNPDSAQVVLSQLQNKKLKEEQQDYIQLAQANLPTDSLSLSQKIHFWNKLLSKSYTSSVSEEIRKHAVISLMKDLSAKKQNKLISYQSLDSLYKEYEDLPWFNSYIKGELLGEYISMQFKNDLSTAEDIEKNLQQLATYSEVSKQPELEFKYLDKKWYFNTIYKKEKVTNYQNQINEAYAILEKAKELNTNQAYLKAYSRLSHSYYNLKMHPSSIQWIYKSLNILEEEKKYEEIGNSYNNIGILNLESDDIPQAITNMKKSITYYNKIPNNQRRIIGTYFNIAQSYKKLDKRDSILYYLDLVQKKLSHLDSENLKHEYLIQLDTELGRVSTENGDYVNAEKKFDNLLQLSDSTLSPSIKAMYFQNYGFLKMAKGDYNKAYEYCKIAENLYGEHDLKYRIECLNCLIDASKKLDNEKMALQHQDERYRLNATYLNQNNAEKLETERLKYQQLKTIEKIENQNELELQKKSKQLYIGLTVLIGTLAILLFLWYLYQNNKNHVRQIALKNETILNKNNQLKRSNERLNRFAHVVAHDIRIPLNSIYQSIHFINEKYDNKIDKEDIKVFNYIENVIFDLTNMISVLLNYSSNHKNINKDEKVPLKDILQKVEKNLSHQIKDSNAKLTYSDQLPILKANTSLVIQLFLNITSNAIKYKKQKLPVIIDIAFEVLENNYVLSSISDNGVGIPEDKHLSIFEFYYSVTNNKKESKSNGIGLAVCKEIVKEFGGEIWVKSEENKGSTFYFTLPLYTEEN